MKFNLVINGKTHPVKFIGYGKLCPYPPVITQAAKLNGACLFNSFAMLLAGRDTYSAIIHHVVCNYISNPVKFKWLQMYIPPKYKHGKDYIIGTSMCNFTTWGTEIEIIALAQISGFDMCTHTTRNVCDMHLVYLMVLMKNLKELSVSVMNLEAISILCLLFNTHNICCTHQQIYTCKFKNKL